MGQGISTRYEGRKERIAPQKEVGMKRLFALGSLATLGIGLLAPLAFAEDAPQYKDYA